MWDWFLGHCGRGNQDGPSIGTLHPSLSHLYRNHLHYLSRDHFVTQGNNSTVTEGRWLLFTLHCKELPEGHLPQPNKHLVSTCHGLW